MDEDVLAASVGGDEAISLRRVEPFDGASGHIRIHPLSFPRQDCHRAVQPGLRVVRAA
eukprot:m.11193 g.11193  ORF g.11193 m.11193 type:complete len:58 (+) comp6411_c0_seq1:491-664(+)